MKAFLVVAIFLTALGLGGAAYYYEQQAQKHAAWLEQERQAKHIGGDDYLVAADANDDFLELSERLALRGSGCLLLALALSVFWRSPFLSHGQRAVLRTVQALCVLALAAALYWYAAPQLPANVVSRLKP
jgi:RsiW-degrading membrane proteinase PrsW (M82 family)